MKTWMNPTVEELDVKLTANGGIPSDVEGFDEWVDKVTDGNVETDTGWDFPVYNDSLKEKTQS